MIIGKRIIDIHILEEPPNMIFEEALYFRIIKFRVDEDRPNIGLNNIREALDHVSLFCLKRPANLLLAGSSLKSNSPWHHLLHPVPR